MPLPARGGRGRRRRLVLLALAALAPPLAGCVQVAVPEPAAAYGGSTTATGAWVGALIGSAIERRDAEDAAAERRYWRGRPDPYAYGDAYGAEY